MRASVSILALVGLAFAANDAWAFGRKARNTPPGDCECGPTVPGTATEYKATPYGYIQSSQYPAYTTPHGYNPILYPNFPIIPTAPIAPVPPAASAVAPAPTPPPETIPAPAAPPKK